jgi:hypothetical protein
MAALAVTPLQAVKAKTSSKAVKGMTSSMAALAVTPLQAVKAKTPSC